MENISSFDYAGSGSGFGSSGSDEEGATLWITVVQIVFCVFGLAGNVIVVFVILVLKEYKKTVTNWYVLQLAIADVMFLCTIPIKIKERHDGIWPGSSSLCKLNEALIFLNYNSSIIFLTVMSFDRYLVVCHNASPLSQKLRRKSSAYIATGIVWAISLVLCTPIFMYSNVTNCRCQYVFAKYETMEDKCKGMGMENVMDFCVRILKEQKLRPDSCGDDESDFKKFPEPVYGEEYESDYNPGNGTTNSSYGPYSYSDYEASAIDGSANSPGNESMSLPYECTYQEEPAAWIGFVLFNFIALFLIPFIIMLVCYSFIVYAMMSRGPRNTALKETSTSQDRSMKERRKLSKSERLYKRTTQICVAYVVLFALCWLPFHTMHLAKLSGINRTKQFCQDITSIAFILVIANSAINPCLYNIVGKKFSKRLRKAILSVKDGVASQIEQSTSSHSGLTAHYRRRRKSGSNSSSMTATTKFSRGKTEMESSERTSGDGLQETG